MGIGRGDIKDTLFPHGESLRNAVRWLSDQLNDGNRISLSLIEQAALRFDLSPLEEDFLRTHWIQSGADPDQFPALDKPIV